MKRSVLLVALAVAMTAPEVVHAQGGPGFLFKRPKIALGVRVGYAVPRMGGELFDYTTDEFIPLGSDTTSSLGFDAPYLGGEIAVRPWDRWDIVLGIGWTRSRSLTEYRRWIDTDNNPIEQETTFEVVSATLGAKYHFQDRGRRIGTLAWVPERLTPFLGTGIGFASYDFIQTGAFLDTSTLEIFGDRLETNGTGFVWYASAGLDVTLFKNALVTAEARYSFSNADVEGSYGGFNDIDLSGLQVMIGLGFQF